jgi:glyceraldehyde 3-phosphate dehydrogenase
MKKLRIAVNGAGRIGRAFIKIAEKRDDMEVVAVNDLSDINNIAYLLKYDTVYGRSGLDVKVSEDLKSLTIDGKEVKYLSEKDPAVLPWKDLDIDVVVESTGLFTSFDKARVHVTAGAKKVVITAPAKGDAVGVDEGTILMGINCDTLKEKVVSSNASCTTNAGSPLLQILSEGVGIEKAILNTIHGYTASQGIVDGPNKKDFKEGRAGAQNIVPTSTGAAIATTKVLTSLSGKFDGLSIRVPVPAGSIVDITFIASRNTTVEEVNSLLKKASTDPQWKGVFTVVEDPIVSSDILGMPFGSIADLGLTKVIDGNLVKVMAWYDNEWGYTATLVEHVAKTGSFI